MGEGEHSLERWGGVVGWERRRGAARLRPVATTFRRTATIPVSMESKARSFITWCSLCLLFLASVLPRPVSAASRDAEVLLALKASVDRSNALPWGRDSVGGVCGWFGVRECSPDGSVTKLVLEFLNLTGSVPAETLAALDQLRVLSFKSNALFGEIPDLSALTNLKSLFLNNNRFSGRIPPSLSTLHRLKVVVLSGNVLSGEIPASLTKLPRLYALFLQDNRLTGQVPAFEQAGLRYLNVSGNLLFGEIPRTIALEQFNASSFAGNPGLCGEQVEKPCIGASNPLNPPSLSPITSIIVSSSSYSPPPRGSRKRRVAAIVAGSVGAFLFLALCVGLVAAFFLFSWRKKLVVSQANGRARGFGAEGKSIAAEGGGSGSVGADGGPSEGPSGAHFGGGGKGGGVFSWEGEGLGKLVFCGGVGEMYSLEELLKASAETLGRGTVGSTYKAVMESGFIVTVKRLKDSSQPGHDEFRRRIEALGRLRHPNLVPLRAYFLAKEERLLVYDYFPNGSLFSLIHGSRLNGGGKPLHWTSCLKIAEDVATGLLHLHQASGVIHGNLKSSNVLLGSDFESCLTDYGLIPHFRLPDSHEDSNGATFLFYRAPESRSPRRSFTQQSDVYSFGVLLLELLTGKTPFQDLVEEHGENIPQWVRSVREEETESGDDPTSGNEASEEKLGALLNIAMACVSPLPENRPTTKEVLRMIRDARAEVLASSNSSDHSPGRWSDTVQSLPREYGSEHLNFAERD